MPPVVSKPRLLDAFCGAGGAGMGYHRAGFDVTGVDIAPQPRYPFTFVQGDALAYIASHGHEFDVIHASPPCQAYARVTDWVGSRSNHPDLIDATRDALEATGLPYVIENVPDAHRKLRTPVMICGSALGLPIRRHRLFELHPSLPLLITPPCQHRPGDYAHDHGAKQPESTYRDAMGCGWMTTHEAREAIPPAYTELIGNHLLSFLQEERAA